MIYATSLSKLKQKLAKWIKKKSVDKIIFVQNGEACAVVMNIKEYESLQSMAQMAAQAVANPAGFQREMKARAEKMEKMFPPGMDDVDINVLNPDLTLKENPQAPAASTFEPLDPKNDKK